MPSLDRAASHDPSVDRRHEASAERSRSVSQAAEEEVLDGVEGPLLELGDVDAVLRRARGAPRLARAKRMRLPCGGEARHRSRANEEARDRHARRAAGSRRPPGEQYDGLEEEEGYEGRCSPTPVREPVVDDQRGTHGLVGGTRRRRTRGARSRGRTPRGCGRIEAGCSAPDAALGQVTFGLAEVPRVLVTTTSARTGKPFEAAPYAERGRLRRPRSRGGAMRAESGRSGRKARAWQRTIQPWRPRSAEPALEGTELPTRAHRGVARAIGAAARARYLAAARPVASPRQLRPVHVRVRWCSAW